MKKLPLLMILATLIIAEILTAYGLFLFANVSKAVYIFFSLMIITAIIFYLLSTKIQERIRIKGRKTVIRNTAVSLIKAGFFTTAALTVLILIQALFYLL